MKRKYVEDFVNQEWNRVEAGEAIFKEIIEAGTKHGTDQHIMLRDAADDSERTTLKAHEFKRNAPFVAGAAIIRHSVRATDKLQEQLEPIMGKDKAETESDLLFAGILRKLAERGEDLMEI